MPVFTDRNTVGIKPRGRRAQVGLRKQRKRYRHTQKNGQTYTVAGTSDRTHLHSVHHHSLVGTSQALSLDDVLQVADGLTLCYRDTLFAELRLIPEITSVAVDQSADSVTVSTFSCVMSLVWRRMLREWHAVPDMKLYTLLNQLSVKAGAALAGIYVVSQTTIGMLLGNKLGAELVPMQLSFTRDRFNAIVSTWAPEHLEQFRHHFYLDFIHPAWYGLMLAWALAKVVPNIRKQLIWIPIIAGLCDLGENSIHASALFGGTFKDLDQPWIWMSSTFALTKWCLVLVSVVLIVTYFVRRRAVKSAG